MLMWAHMFPAYIIDAPPGRLLSMFTALPSVLFQKALKLTAMAQEDHKLLLITTSRSTVKQL